LQIQTGCEGLNLQENYSEIYFVSPHWNPAIEEQAIARCHRIGQMKEVTVTRFEMSNFVKDEDQEMETRTVDNYVNSVQDIKRKIIDEFIN
jgi:SNF2 family DNA or RNA helicase